MVYSKTKTKFRQRNWALYILHCGDDSLYTGITTNLVNRLKKHQSGKGAAYTRSHLPVELVYKKSGFTRSGALKKEALIKSLSKKLKWKLVQEG